jgi:(S)-2-hydroxyglutarate dehydrogenase
MDDFVILEGERSVHVLNAPSPAATACIPIGETIVDRIPRHALPRASQSGR